MQKFRQFLIGIMGLWAFLTANDCCYDCSDSVWFDAEYLYWKIQDGPKVIPLVEEFSLTDPEAHIVIGDKKKKINWRPGARFTFGFWFDEEQCSGIEAQYLFLCGSSSKQRVFSDGTLVSPLLAFPYIDTSTGTNALLEIAFPGSYEGLATLKLENEFQGIELNGLYRFYYCNEWNIDLLGGFRYLNFKENLRFRTNSPYINSALNNVYYTRDRFHVDSNFYGVQIGTNFYYNCSDFLFNMQAKVALGGICQSAKIHGEFVLNDFTNFGLSQSFEGGFLALPSNIGHHKKMRFSVVPEIDFNIGYQICDGFSVLVGYHFLYITNVLRASKQLSNKINPTQSALLEYTPTPVLVGEAQPRGHLRSSNLWVQGLNIGFEFLF